MRYSGISYWYEFNELDAKTHPIPEAIIDEGPLRMELLNDGDSGTLRATGTDGVRHDCSYFWSSDPSDTQYCQPNAILGQVES